MPISRENIQFQILSRKYENYPQYDVPGKAGTINRIID